METNVNTLASRDVSSSSEEKNRGKSCAIATSALVSLVVIATVLAYSPVLFDFFLGDDYVHLTWLKDAVKNPELIWRNFHSSWLDGTTTRFYRPLISVFMVTDYLGWGINGLGYHITNLLFHLIATVFLFFTARIFLQDSTAPDPNNADSEGTGARRNRFDFLYPLGAALIFGLYPLHTEAVSWITGRVDAVVTAFYVATFYFYLRWRKNGGTAWLGATAVSFALGLLSKEMALTLPPSFMLYEALLGPNAILRNGRKKFDIANLMHWAISAVKPVLFFWLMVVVYFGVRRYALGTFVGGYDDSLFFIADMKHFVLSWLHGLRMFLIPLNKGLMGAHHWITRGWEVSLVLCSLMVCVNLWIEKKLFRLWLFNCIFMGFCFAPVYKIFTIADDLQGARLAHVATVALSLLLSMAFIIPKKRSAQTTAQDEGQQATSSAEEKENPQDSNNSTPAMGENSSATGSSPVQGTVSKSAVPVGPPPDAGTLTIGLRALLCLGFSTICAAALWTNNQAWSTAGREANAIRAGLSKLYETIEGDPQVLLLSLPDQINGAYICRNAVWGMTKHPQLQRDVMNCLSINKYEQILPFGYLKDSLWESRDKVKIYSWNSKQATFLPLEISRNDSGKKLWTKNELREIVTVKQGQSGWSADGALEVKGDNSKNGRPELILNLGNRNSFDIEFIAVKLRNLDTTGGSTANLATEGADLLYTNDVSPEYDLPNRTHADFVADSPSQTLVLPLRSLPEWSLGGKSHGLLLKLPHNCNLAIDSIEIAAPDSLMPRLSFQNSGYMGTKGYMHLSEKDNKATINVDASKVPSAAGVIVEITRTNLLFETQNTALPSKVTMKDELKGTVSGDIELKRDMFPATGIYEARTWAVDKDGKRLGVAGDHFIISVDS
jgi:hypothetical protein